MRKKRKKGNPETTKVKQDYVKSLIGSDASVTMSGAGKKVIEKYGSMLAFDKLREAFLAGGGKLTSRGRKRATTRKTGRTSGIGRRASDMRAAVLAKTLSGMPQHMVIVLSGTKAVPNVFSTGKQAEDYIRKLISGGMAATSIGYYERRAMDVTVAVTI